MLNGLLLRSALAPSRGKQHQKHQPKQVSGVCWVYDIHASVCVCKFVYMSMHVCVLIRLQMHPLGAKSFFSSSSSAPTTNLATALVKILSIQAFYFLFFHINIISDLLSNVTLEL